MSGIWPRQSETDEQAEASTSTGQQGAASTSTASQTSRADIRAAWWPTNMPLPNIAASGVNRSTIPSSRLPSRRGQGLTGPGENGLTRERSDRRFDPLRSPQTSTNSGPSQASEARQPSSRRTPTNSGQPQPSRARRQRVTTPIGSSRTHPTANQPRSMGSSTGTVTIGGTQGIDWYSLPMPDVSFNASYPPTCNRRSENDGVWRTRCNLAQDLLRQCRRACTVATRFIPSTTLALSSPPPAPDGLITWTLSEDGNSYICQRLPSGFLVAAQLKTLLYASEDVIRRTEESMSQNAQPNRTPVTVGVTIHFRPADSPYPPTVTSPADRSYRSIVEVTTRLGCKIDGQSYATSRDHESSFLNMQSSLGIGGGDRPKITLLELRKDTDFESWPRRDSLPIVLSEGSRTGTRLDREVEVLQDWVLCGHGVGTADTQFVFT